MQLHNNNRARLQVEMLENRITPSFSWGATQGGLAVAVEQPAAQAAFEIKDFSFGVENSTTMDSAVVTTGIDWSGPGDTLTINKESEPVLAGWDQVVNTGAVAAQTPVETAADAFTTFEEHIGTTAPADQPTVQATVDAFIGMASGYDLKMGKGR